MNHLWRYIAFILLGYFFEKVSSSAKLEIRFIRYDNADGEGSNGNPCDGFLGISRSECDPYFKVCLDTSSSTDTSMDVCPYGFMQTGYVHNRNTFDFNATNIGDSPNPIVFSISTWPSAGMRIKVDVYDDDSSNDHDHVELFPAQVFMDAPGSDNASAVDRFVFFAGRTTLQTTVKAYCDAHWYGSRCDTNCEAKDSNLYGHYDCSSTGSRRCHEGWEGFNCDVNIDDCAGSPCLNDGDCIDGLNEYSCRCPASFTGVNCEVELDGCSPHFCANDGICVSKSTGPMCVCPTGWEGDTCEIRVNPCDADPCTNGGICTTFESNFTCDCPPGFTGDICEVDEDECISIPCINGHCDNTYGSFRCICFTGHTGELCDQEDWSYIMTTDAYADEMSTISDVTDLTSETTIEVDPGDPCSNIPCKNGATCKLNRGDVAVLYYCICTEGYIGDNCDTLVDNCASSPCENFGSCENKVGGYQCRCQDGWTGPNCNQDVNECLVENICENWGTCMNRIGSFHCTCMPGWTGERCQDREPCPCKNGGNCSFTTSGVTCKCQGLWTGDLCEVSPCENSPCVNGICRVTPEGNTSCKCPPGYTGDLCQTDKDDCSPGPCRNGGRCHDGINSYTCTCPMGFSGNKCEMSVSPKFFVFEGTLNASDMTPFGDDILARVSANTDDLDLTFLSGMDACQSYDGKDLTIYEFQIRDSQNQVVPDEVVNRVISDLRQEEAFPHTLYDGPGCGNPGANIAESKENENRYGEEDQWRVILGFIVGCLCVVLVALVVGLILYTRDKSANEKPNASQATVNPTFKYRDDSSYTNMKSSGLGRTPRSFRCHSGDYTSTRVNMGDE